MVWRSESSFSNSYYTHVLGRMLLFYLDYSTLPLIRTLYHWVSSKEASSTIFKVFGMTRPGIEPRSLGPLVNTLLYPWSVPYITECQARRHQVPFLMSLVWRDLGLNPGLSDHWWTLYPLAQWAGITFNSIKHQTFIYPQWSNSSFSNNSIKYKTFVCS